MNERPPEPATADDAEPRRSAVAAIAWIRRRVTHVGGRVTDVAVRVPIVTTFVVAIFVVTMALVPFGYAATREWRRDMKNLLLERRANEALAAVSAAISADMKGAASTAIVSFNTTVLNEDPPDSMFQVAAHTFARFPYPESVVLWQRTGKDDGTMYAFNRADRPPPWEARRSSDAPSPVVLVRDPPALAELVAAVRTRATAASPLIMLEQPIEGTLYQIVAHALFASGPSQPLLGFAAFTVNEPWLPAQYFDPLVEQAEKILGSPGGLSITVADEEGRVVTKRASVEADGAAEAHKRFRLLFLDPALFKSLSSDSTRVRVWTVRVRSLPDQTLLERLQGARPMFFLISTAAGASLLALVLTVRANRARVALASMKSDLVAAVTHELKTPIASIRLVGDTLANGRYRSSNTVQEYAGLLSTEALRLESSIDNLLTYARYSRTRAADATELVDVEAADLVEDALQGFRPNLATLEFELTVDLPLDLPQVCVDRAAVIRALENIIDNAIKYSDATRRLAVSGRAVGKFLTLTVKDAGSGICREDQARIFDRFYRGRNAHSSGSGLGLAIAKRIVESHGGRIDVRSAVGSGTEVDVTLPASARRSTACTPGDWRSASHERKDR